jgi:hypothetical protein
MLPRLILLLLLSGFAWWIYKTVRGHPLLRVAAAWTDEAILDPTVAEALKLRQSMARILIEGRASHAVALLADVDGVLERMVEMSGMGRTLRDEADAIGGDSMDRVQPSLDRLAADANNALGWLKEAHGVLLETAAAEVDAAVGSLQSSMAAHAEELRQSVEAGKEVNAAVRKAKA